MSNVKNIIKRFEPLEAVSLKKIVDTYDIDDDVREEMSEYYSFFVAQMMDQARWIDIEKMEEEEIGKLSGVMFDSSKWDSFIDEENGDLFVEATFSLNSDDGLGSLVDTQPFIIGFGKWGLVAKSQN